MTLKIVTIGSLIFLHLAGCAPVVKNPTPMAHPEFQATLRSAEKEYSLQAGDQLDIRFYYNPELNEQVTIRPDGRISLQLVREITAAGLTPGELTDLLTKKYAAELKRPEITVIVRSFSSQRIYVDGEINKAGMVNLTVLTTVLQAISQAGGWKDTARRDEVIVIRRGTDNRPLVIQLNLDKAIDGTDTGQDIILRPFDIVYVPKSAIANVNVWMDQYIRKNIPINTGIFYNPIP